MPTIKSSEVSALSISLVAEQKIFVSSANIFIVLATIIWKVVYIDYKY